MTAALSAGIADQIEKLVKEHQWGTDDVEQ